MLTQEDFRSPAWRSICDHLEARLTLLRLQNDAPQDAEKTANIRGAIAEIKGLLALDKTKPSH